jgi:ABC-type amino acid transport substrate-binding protein
VRILAIVAAVAVVGCAKSTTTAGSPAPAPPSGTTTLAKCVINQGSTPPTPATGTSFTTQKAGTLLVGSDTAFPPFESIQGGKAVGFDVDLIDEIGKRIGNLQVQVQTAVFDTIFTALAAGRFDVVVSAVTIKPDRKKTVDFTDPYFKADLSLSVRAADASRVRGVDDLKGKVVGTQSGTTSEDCTNAELKAKGRIANVRTYDTAVAAFDDLAAQRVDAVLIDLPTAETIAAQRTGIRVVQVIRTNEQYGIAVSKKNPNLREAINKALKSIRDDGTYRRLYVKWFKTQPPA